MCRYSSLSSCEDTAPRIIQYARPPENLNSPVRHAVSKPTLLNMNRVKKNIKNVLTNINIENGFRILLYVDILTGKIIVNLDC